MSAGLHKVPLLSSATELFFLGTPVASMSRNAGGNENERGTENETENETERTWK